MPSLMQLHLAARCSARKPRSRPSNPGLYYECPTSGCVVTAEALAPQVQNPVTLFATDNNGVMVELPAVVEPETSVSGSLIFGIGTQSNNGLNGATVCTVDANGNFITTYQGQSYGYGLVLAISGTTSGFLGWSRW
jgi:Protein of unknown function (DUF3443)